VHGYSKVIFSSFDYNIAMISVALIVITAIYLMPFVMLPLAILFDWPLVITNIIILQTIFVLVTRIILAIRFKMKAVDVLLHPLSIMYLLSMAVNSVYQFRFNIGVYWKGRTYNVSNDEEEELKVINDSFK